jgi:tetratricopeptide (TPR) repeat protein
VLNFSSFLSGLLLSMAISSSLYGEQVEQDGFVGSQRCVSCHATEYQAWQDSHHDLAMQPATAETVLGDFSDKELIHYGVTSRFYKKENRFFVKTEGSQGTPQEFEILYTFGVQPLQQYLVEIEPGKLQSLTIAWDSRPKKQGGQRWFHLQPDEEIAHNDVLHWTGPYYNWNSRCAECHSTNLKKNFSTQEMSYSTQWSEMNVACEACHGPAADHLNWVDQGESKSSPVNFGFGQQLTNQGVWQHSKGDPTANRIDGKAASDEADTCAHCHARRQFLGEDYLGASFADNHRLQLLDQGVYYPDGQILDEDYVYGSFLQSKMHRNGVVCSNCHDPHSLKPKFEGNALCTQCHQAPVFDTPSHHHHKENSDGAACVNCHMPATTYMVVDDRRDHSFRIPRPDLTAEYGVPNACNGCHRDQNAQWAEKHAGDWYGAQNSDHFVAAIVAGQQNRPEASPLLIELAADGEQAAIVRATSLSLLQRSPSQESIATAVQLLGDENSLVRIAALGNLEVLPIAQRYQLAAHLLNDPVKTVRIEAARFLAATPDGQLNELGRKKLDEAVSEYIETLLFNGDIANSHASLGILYSQLGKQKQAEQSYKVALELDSKFVPALLNLADLYRQLGRDWQGESLLQRAVAVMPDNAQAHFALGLRYVRKKQLITALPHLKSAADLQPGYSHYAYVYAVALDSNGDTPGAIKVLEKTLNTAPGDQQIVSALVSFYRKIGGQEQAEKYQRYLEKL